MPKIATKEMLKSRIKAIQMYLDIILDEQPPEKVNNILEVITGVTAFNEYILFKIKNGEEEDIISLLQLYDCCNEEDAKRTIEYIKQRIKEEEQRVSGIASEFLKEQFRDKLGRNKN